jgi:predicted metalloprotease
MRLDDLRESENVEDRRGGGFGGGGFGGPMVIGGGGLGIVGVIIALLLGVNPAQLLGGAGDQAQNPGGFQGPPGASSPARPDDPEVHFAAKILGSTEDVWGQEFRRRGLTYQPAIFVPYDEATETACGGGQAAMGPFYCPGDHRVYIDLSFFRELSDRFGAPGQFAQAYVIAHEVGHHVQTLLGESDRAAELEPRLGQRGASGVSVRLELQADCLAGVWANRANASEHILEAGDVEQGLAAANAVGDDTLQRKMRGRVVPDSFTHGTSAQRVRWFTRGFDAGRLEACDTLDAQTL